MKRFHVKYGQNFIEPAWNGEYVKYAEANALLQLKNEEIEALQRQLDEVTRERDQYKTVCVLADALRNHERGMVAK